jgi:signal transduction histidine kinase/DNA-binding NarL/FixJ family response regulator
VLLVTAAAGMGFATTVPVAAEPWHDLPVRWKIRVGDDPRWRDPAFDDGAWRRVGLRDGWDEQDLSGVDGVVWYRRAVDVGDRPGEEASRGELGVFLISPSFGGVQVYAGGELIGESPGWRLPLAVQTHEVYAVPSEAVDPDGRVALALRVRRVGWASDQAVRGAPVGDVALIGDRLALREHDALLDARERLGSLHLLMLAVLFGGVGLYHLSLALGGRDRRAHVWFGVLALLFGANTLTNSIWIFDLTLRLDWTVRWAAASGHLLAAVVIQFLWILFERRISWPLRGYQLSQVALGVWAVSWPRVEHVVATGHLRWLWLIPGLALIAGRIVVELRRGGREARILAGGALVAVVLQGSESVAALVGLPLLLGFSLAPFGFAAFLGAMGLALWERFRRLQLELEALKDDLERKVRDRTADLERAKEQAEIANRLKDRFLANVSHELRTPLTGIRGITELLLAEGSRGAEDREDDRAELLEQLERSSARLQELIDDLLDLVRLEDGSLEVAVTSFDPRAPVSRSIEALEPMIAQSGLALETTVAPGVPESVEGDPARLRRVLTQLVGNAFKFTEEGTVRISLESRPLGPGRLELLYAVTDTGSGIPREELESLFEPFRRLDGPPGRLHGGIGVGLTLARRLVEAWGGRIWVESSAGRGSTFSFTVPVRSAEGEPAGHGHGPAPATGSPRDVLVAEDNEITRSLLERFLRRLGHRVELARDGSEVLAAVARRRYDVVLLDVQMPGVDGLEACRRIRRRIAPPERPLLVALTASYGADQQAACRAAGVDALLPKPIDFESLERVVAGEPAPPPQSARRSERNVDGGPSGAEEPVLDPERLAQLRALEESAGDPIVEAMLRTLLARLDRELPLLVRRLQDREWDALSRLAHSLVGNAANVGAARLARRFRKLERAAGSEDRAAAHRLVEALPAEVDRLRRAAEATLGA